MENSIICTNVLDGMKRIKDNSVHLIVTSPPYNVGINYDNYTDDLPHDDYLKWIFSVWKECYRVLVDGGRICINIDATTNMDKDGLLEKVHPLHVDFTNQLREIGYIYRGEIIWCKQNAAKGGTAWGSYCSPSSPHIRRNYEYIIVGSKKTLKLDGSSNYSDITKDEFHKWTLAEWKMVPETRKKSHPAQFPVELPIRCIKLFSYVGNVVLDPFNGSGTTTSMAYQFGRKYIGLDISEYYCKVARNGLSAIDQEFSVSGGYVFRSVSSPNETLIYNPKTMQEPKIWK